MESVRQYLLCITATALFCSVMISILGEKSAYASIVKMISGILMTLVVLSPLTKLDFSSLLDLNFPVYQAGSQIAGEGTRQAENTFSTIIKEKAEEYILDKAAAYHLQVNVQVELTDGDPPVPCKVTVTGNASPYAKGRLQEIITNDLGIPKEDQEWK